MPRPQPRSVTGIPPNLDKQKLEAARRLAELAGEHLEECVSIVLEVARDRKSRQRLAAVSMLAEFASGGEVVANAAGSTTRVQIAVVSSNDIAKLEQMQRQAVEARVVNNALGEGES